MQSSLTRKIDTAAQGFVARRAVLLGSGLAVIFCMTGFQWLQVRLGAPMLDQLNGYDREALHAQMLLYGATGRDLHVLFTLTLDMLFPLVYGPFFAALLALAARPFASGRLRLAPYAVVPVMASDYLENLQLAALLTGFPALSDGQIAVAAATTQAKFVFIAVSFVLLGGLLLARLAKTALRR